MAVGLAVIAADQIIICSDQPANADRENADEGVEDCLLSRSWRALIASAPPVVSALHISLYESFGSVDVGNENDVLRAIHCGLWTFKKYLNDVRFGLEFGLTCEEFRDATHLFSELRSGELKNLPDEPFPAELIVAGFIKDKDGSRKPTLFRSHMDWRVEQKSSFHTIGDGSQAARLSLLSRGVSAELSVHEASYIAFEAKRFAESVSRVSKQTSLTVYAADGSERRYDPEGYLSQLYAKFGPRPFTGIEVAPDLLERS